MEASGPFYFLMLGILPKLDVSFFFMVLCFRGDKVGD